LHNCKGRGFGLLVNIMSMNIISKIDKLDDVQRAGLELMILYNVSYGVSSFKNNVIKFYSKEWELSEKEANLKIQFILHLHLKHGEEVRRLCKHFLYPYSFDVLEMMSNYRETISIYKRLYTKSKDINAKIDNIIVDIFKANRTFQKQRQYIPVLEPLLLQYTI